MITPTTAARNRHYGRLLAVVSVAALGLVPGATAAMADDEPKVDICHATNADGNQYVMNSPDASGDLNGHAGHTGPIWSPGLKDQKIDWGDIIPPIPNSDLPNGLNWTAEGQAWYANDCRVPITGTVDKTNDANADATFSDDETATSVGSDVTFSVTVTNTSIVSAMLTGLVDTVGGDPVAFTPSPDPVGSTLAAGASATFTFTLAGYSPADGESLVNTITATMVDLEDETNTGTAIDTSTVRTAVPRDVAIVKTGTATALPGDTLTWTLTVTNTGTIAAQDVEITDTLPVDVTFVSATGDGWTCEGTTDISCSLEGDLAVEASSAVTLVGTLSEDFEGTTISNTAVVTPEDATPGDNTSTFTTDVTQLTGGGGGGGGGGFTGGGGGGGATTLPRTGGPLSLLAAQGAALLLLGTSLLLLTPRRRRS